jgi:ankyrin repeat protein
LKELPKTLDETYERILQGIDEEKRDDAHRLFQWLTVSSRPLQVEELAEAFVIDFDAETAGIPNFEPSWREPNAETAVLSSCSTLVTVVNIGVKKVVQFSHFSVREYLTSDRLANSAPHSSFHVLLKPAHTLLAKACLSVLVQLNYSIDRTRIRDFPLAQYATAHWMDHALFEDVSSDIRDGLDCLFDRNKPHLAAWLWLSDIDDVHRRRLRFPPRPEYPGAVPLYYAALCGIRDLTERLVAAHPQDINAPGGCRGAPLNAALHSGHLNIAWFLLERGATGENGGMACQTALYIASSRGYAEVVRSLLDRGADLKAKCNALDEYGRHVQWTPLLVALEKGRPEIARMLLERGVDVNYMDNRGSSPLHIARRRTSIDLVQLLLDHGANINASDTWRGETVLHDASSKGHITVVKLLLEHGANVDSRSKSRWTPLHCTTVMGHSKVAELLLDHGADVHAQNEDGWTALHLAAFNGHLEIVAVVLKHGADPHAQTNEGKTSIHLAKMPLQPGQTHPHIMQLLSEHTSGSE